MAWTANAHFGIPVSQTFALTVDLWGRLQNTWPNASMLGVYNYSVNLHKKSSHASRTRTWIQSWLILSNPIFMAKERLQWKAAFLCDQATCKCHNLRIGLDGTVLLKAIFLYYYLNASAPYSYNGHRESPLRNEAFKSSRLFLTRHTSNGSSGTLTSITKLMVLHKNSTWRFSHAYKA